MKYKLISIVFKMPSDRDITLPINHCKCTIQKFYPAAAVAHLLGEQSISLASVPEKYFFPTAITSKLFLSSSSLSSITKVSTVSTVYLQHNQGFYCLPGEDFVVQLSPARAHRHMSGKQIFENLLLMD